MKAKLKKTSKETKQLPSLTMLSVKRLVKIVAGSVPLASRIPVSIANFVCSVSEKALRNSSSCGSDKTSYNYHTKLQWIVKNIKGLITSSLFLKKSCQSQEQYLWIWSAFFHAHSRMTKFTFILCDTSSTDCLTDENEIRVRHYSVSLRETGPTSSYL